LSEGRLATPVSRFGRSVAAALAHLAVSGQFVLMDSANTVTVQPATPKKQWRHLAFITLLTVVVTPVAGAFVFSRRACSNEQLAGVLMLVAQAVVCCLAFLRCPPRPWWGKIAALVLTVPSLFFAMIEVMRFVAFGWKQ
jgi:hypothetical protein